MFDSTLYSIIVPGPVTELTMIPISSTVLQVSWEFPNITNGEIKSYSVVVYTHAETKLNITVTHTTVLVSNLGKCHCMYFVIVSNIL